MSDDQATKPLKMPHDPLAIPKSVRLPFGYTVKIVIMTAEELAGKVGGPAYGGWDNDTRTIYLNATRPRRLMRADLAHEMQHAVIDFTNWAYMNLAADPTQ